MSERVGDWMQTYTGKQFYVADIRPEDFDIRDVAQALSNMCRYAGHTSRFYSVAEHSFLVSQVAEKLYGLEAAYEGLLHDGSEAYLPDIPKPVKISLPAVAEAAEYIERAFNKCFGIPFPTSPEIKELDVRIVVDEKQELMNNNGVVLWHNYNKTPKLNVPIVGIDPESIRTLWLHRYWRLVDELETRKTA